MYVNFICTTSEANCCTRSNITVIVSGESVLVTDEDFATPVEAKNSVAIGSFALTLCGFELLFILLLDADHIVKFHKTNTFVRIVINLLRKQL